MGSFFQNSRKVSESKFVIVGVGALGSRVFGNVLRFHPAHLLLIDPDHAEEEDRAKSQHFASPRSLGRNKAEYLAELARSQAPDTVCRALPCEFADTGWAELADASVLFSCVDNDLARLEIAMACRKLGVPVCDAGLLTGDGCVGGRVTWFPAGLAACFGCKLRPARLRELLLFAQAQVRPCSLATNGSFFVSPAVASRIASLQIDFGLERLLSRERRSESLEVRTVPSSGVHRFENAVSSVCPFHALCEETFVPAEHDRSLADLLKPLSSRKPYVFLEWPVCVLAACRGCGCQWSPMIRCSALRRTGQCPRCTSPDVAELDSIRVIEHDSMWADHTPCQLGIPHNHLLTLRFGKVTSA